MNLSAGDPEAQTRVAAFMQGLQEAVWVFGTNLRVDGVETPTGLGKARKNLLHSHLTSSWHLRTLHWRQRNQ